MGTGWKEREFANFSTTTSTQISNHKTTKKNDISKQHSKQAKKGEVERNSTKCLLIWFS